MSKNFICKEYIKYSVGDGFFYCHVEAQHAVPPNSDLFTKKITTKIIKKTGCAGIISTVSRVSADLNRIPNEFNKKAISEYRNSIKNILQHLSILNSKNYLVSKPYLHLSIHGMKDIHHGAFAIEVGTFDGQSCSMEMKEWFRNILLEKSQKFLPPTKIIFDEIFDGDKSIVFHRIGDNIEYAGYGPNFHTFQIEISLTLRKHHLYEIVELFSQIIYQFQEEIVNESEKKRID